MGIPSYYKRLIDRYPALVTKGYALTGLRADVLLMDFNCLIYQCVRDPALPAYSQEGREAWETGLLEAVKRYTVKVWETAGRPREVLIAVDGVVPMAKIRQQRQRRFKSLWMAAAEREAGVRSGETWDTNAITPGTEFMEKLGRALRGLAESRGTGWTVSGADEAGEGEQKLMAWVRERGGGGGPLAGKRVVVYGLDADLIVLSLLSLATAGSAVAEWRLLRELTEFEGAKAGADAVGAFGALNVRELLGILVPPGMSAAEYILEYVCAMSFLGNDFLPHSLTVHLREGGHDMMCQALVRLHTGGGRLVQGGRVQAAAAAEFVRGWVEAEEEWMAQHIAGKYKARGPPPRNDRERAMVRVNNLPLEWKEEGCLWSTVGGLISDWRDVYRGRWLRGASVAQVCREYISGLQWILDYYCGRPVSYSWYFPWNVPPLWGDLVGELEKVEDVAAPPVTSPVAPQEQLAMVLPEGSWWLVRDTKLRGLPMKAPVYWPQSFGFFSAGRRWMWECEAEIPILTADRMRGLLTCTLSEIPH